MKRRTLNTSEAPKIVVEVKGDLTISGWAQSAVMVETDVAADLLMEQNGNVITIVGETIRLQAPFAATCLVESCRGQAILRQLAGPISLGSVAGNLILDSVGGPDAPVHVETVGGEFSAHAVAGPLTVQLVGGHAVVADVAGACVLDQIGGHLELSQAGAGFRAEVGGNVSLDFAPAPGQTYRVEAGGSILCSLPDDANADLTMESPVFAAGDGDDVSRVVLGEGGPTVRLEAGGAIRLDCASIPPANAQSGAGGDHKEFGPDFGPEFGSDFDADFDLDLDEFGALAESFATELTAKITSKLSVLSERLPGMLSSAGLSGQEVNDISRKVREATQRAAQKAQSQAQQAVERATRKAERKVAKARRKAERASHWGVIVRPPSPPQPPRPPVMPSPPAPPIGPASTPVGQDERMLILRMLEERKISVAQAEALLAAMEGRSGA